MNSPDALTSNDTPKTQADPLELALIPIWKSVLGLEEISPTDNFFNLGGNQKALADLDARLRVVFNRGIPPGFEQSPTIQFLGSSLLVPSESEGNPDRLEAVRLENRKRRGRLKEREFLITPEYALTRWIVQGMPYSKALLLIANLARSTWFKWLFGFSQSEFKRWYALTGSEAPYEQTFEAYLHNQLANYLPFDHNFQREPLEDFFTRLASSSSRFQRTLAQSLLNTPPRADHPFFLFKNLETFTQALDVGKGVILVTFHGNVRFPQFQDIEWLSGAGLIDIISFTHGHLGKYTSAREIDLTDFSSSNAGVALDARKRLIQGKAIFILSDTKDRQSKNYSLDLFGKQLQFKAGFAEISLLTGAPIIPVYKYLLTDGRVMTEFLTPLTTHKTEYPEKVRDLVQQYVDFIAQAWKDHPEAMRRKLIKEHLSQ